MRAVSCLHHLAHQSSVIFLSFGLYLGGAFIYVKRIPECWFPGMFDIWVSGRPMSHRD